MYYYKDEKSRFVGGRLFLIPLVDKTLFIFFIYFINWKLWFCGKKSSTFFPAFCNMREKKLLFFPANYFFSRQITFFPGKRKIKKNKVKKKNKNYVLTGKKCIFYLEELSFYYFSRFARKIKHSSSSR